MPSPDEVHQSTVERNSPRWWIAFITGQHCGFATKDQRRIDFTPGGILAPPQRSVDFNEPIYGSINMA